MTCNHCGTEHNKRGKYCSSSCRQKAYRERQNTSLPVVSAPRTNTYQMNSPQYVLGGRINSGLGDYASQQMKKQLNVNTPPSRDVTRRGARKKILWNGGISLLGAYIGYRMADKKKDRWNNILIGLGAGAVASQYLEVLFDPFGQFEDAENSVTNRNVTLSDSLYKDGQILSAREYSNLPTYEIKWNGKYGSFFNSVGQNDIVMIYGGQGSGKSHMVTQIASELGNDYNVLYVTAEEGISSHVQDRFNKYSLKNRNVHILPTRRHKDVLTTLKQGNYQFAIIDSLQGLDLPYDSQAGYLERLVRETSLHGLFFLNQMNKNGEFKGYQELGHITSAEIMVENGIAKTIKNRQSPNKPEIEVFGGNTGNNVLSIGKVGNQ